MSYSIKKTTRADLDRAKNRLSQCLGVMLDRPAILNQQDPYLWYLYGRDVGASYAVERKILNSSNWMAYLYLRDCKVLNRQAFEQKILQSGNLEFIRKIAMLPKARCFKEALELTIQSKSIVAIWLFCQTFESSIKSTDMKRLAKSYKTNQTIYQKDFKWIIF